MKKIKVKFLESIAILADPKPRQVLDEKYNRFADELRAKEKPPSAATIKYLIDQKKLSDRYGEIANGFGRDMAWKSGDEAMISADLAEKWQEAGICNIVGDDSSTKKAA